MTLVAGQPGVLADEGITGLPVIEGSRTPIRPANEFEISSDMLLMAGNAVGVPLRSVNDARVVSLLLLDSNVDLRVAGGTLHFLPPHSNDMTRSTLQDPFEIRMTGGQRTRRQLREGNRGEDHEQQRYEGRRTHENSPLNWKWDSRPEPDQCNWGAA